MRVSATTSTESPSPGRWASKDLPRWFRHLNRLLQLPGLMVLCKVEIKARPSRGRSHTTHELISIPAESVENSILLIRSQRVILDRTLAEFYGVTNKVLHRAVKGHSECFPADFMFQLTLEETETAAPMNREPLRSRFVTIRKPHGKRLKDRPYAFTEHGILMLSSVLQSERATLVNIQIIRAFVRLREKLAAAAELTKRIDDLERKYDDQFESMFEAIDEILTPDEPERTPIGFRSRRLSDEGKDSEVISWGRKQLASAGKPAAATCFLPQFLTHLPR